MPVAISNNKEKEKQSREDSSSKTGARPSDRCRLLTSTTEQSRGAASLILLLTGVAVHHAVGVVCPRLRLQHFGQPLSLGVGVVPEVEEEEQENQAVQADDVDEDRELVGAIRDEEILGDVAGHHHKLDLRGEVGVGEDGRGCWYRHWSPSEGRWKNSIRAQAYQLDGGEVLLPPQVLLVVGAHGSQTIVGVHDDVDHTVKKGMERPHTTWSSNGDCYYKILHLSSNLFWGWIHEIKKLYIVKPTWCKADSEPPGERHDGVMVHVQERHLAVLFPEHEEDLKETKTTASVSDGGGDTTADNFQRPRSTYRVQHLDEL